MSHLEEIFEEQAAACRHRFQTEQNLALEECRGNLKRDSQNPEHYIRLARLEEPSASVEVLREGIKRCKPSAKLTRAYVYKLEKLNRTEEAIAAAREATQMFPDDIWLRIQEKLLLPIVYQSSNEVQRCRQRFSDGLVALTGDIPLNTPRECEKALQAIAAHVNFYLPYQGGDDLELQRRYGQLATRIAAARFPEWAQPVPMPQVEGKLRIGYVSGYFRDHSVSKNHIGWLLEHNRSDFEIYAYHVGQQQDAITNEVRGCTTRFHQSQSIEDLCMAIRSDNLHILVFVDIGMDPGMTPPAALRLAPIQCMAWGHPVTSGLPTIDYFLSSALMEPMDGQSHYSERLVPLPGVGVCYRKPIIPRMLLSKTRHDFGLRDDAIVYLCCQSLFKYLPDHDDVFSLIAKRVPNSQFVFITPNGCVAADFRRRIEREFSKHALSANDHCVFVPTQTTFDYWNLNLCADVYLDSIEWSGFNTTIEALACGLPIVTLPGRFMRGRHSYAILTQLGMTETIARDKAHYVDIATRLGTEKGWQAKVVQTIADRQQRLYYDVRCVSALEEFYKRVVREKSLAID